MLALNFKLGSRNVPIISDLEIDVGAERLLLDYDRQLLTNPQPLNIEAFAEDYLDLRIHYDNLSHNGCIWGTIVFVNSRMPIYDKKKKRAEYTPVDANTIVIDNSIAGGESEAIFRSSLGHECGHGVYHREYFMRRFKYPHLYGDDESDVGIFACKKSDIVGSQQWERRVLKSDRDFIEHHAKRFSAALLMPRTAMCVVCSDKSFRDLAWGEAPDLSNEILAEQVADVFNVSFASALIRIKQLKLGFKSRYVLNPYTDFQAKYTR